MLTRFTCVKKDGGRPRLCSPCKRFLDPPFRHLSRRMQTTCCFGGLPVCSPPVLHIKIFRDDRHQMCLTTRTSCSFVFQSVRPQTEVTAVFLCMDWRVNMPGFTLSLLFLCTCSPDTDEKRTCMLCWNTRFGATSIFSWSPLTCASRSSRATWQLRMRSGSGWSRSMADRSVARVEAHRVRHTRPPDFSQMAPRHSDRAHGPLAFRTCGSVSGNRRLWAFDWSPFSWRPCCDLLCRAVQVLLNIRNFPCWATKKGPVSIWQTREATLLRTLECMGVTSFDQCPLGSVAIKPTTILHLRLPALQPCLRRSYDKDNAVGAHTEPDPTNAWRAVTIAVTSRQHEPRFTRPVSMQSWQTLSTNLFAPPSRAPLQQRRFPLTFISLSLQILFPWMLYSPITTVEGTGSDGSVTLACAPSTMTFSIWKVTKSDWLRWLSGILLRCCRTTQKTRKNTGRNWDLAHRKAGWFQLFLWCSTLLEITIRIDYIWIHAIFFGWLTMANRYWMFDKPQRRVFLLLGQWPKSYHLPKSRINHAWPMGKAVPH